MFQIRDLGRGIQPIISLQSLPKMLQGTSETRQVCTPCQAAAYWRCTGKGLLPEAELLLCSTLTDPATPITRLLSPTAFKVRLNTCPSKGNGLSPYLLPSPEHHPCTKSLISSSQRQDTLLNLGSRHCLLLTDYKEGQSWCSQALSAFCSWEGHISHLHHLLRT